MARMAFFLPIVCFSLALAFVVEVSGRADGGFYGLEGAEGSVPIQECPQKCNYRCSATKHQEPCLKYCNICCEKCLCVPSGTSGNKEECPCYNNMRSSQGNSKCP